MVQLSLAKAQQKTLLLYHKPYCPYCRELYPIWRKVVRTIKKQAKGLQIKSVDCAKQPQAQMQAKVGTVPAIKLAVSGKATRDYTGKREHDAMVKWINRAL